MIKNLVRGNSNPRKVDKNRSYINQESVRVSTKGIINYKYVISFLKSSAGSDKEGYEAKVLEG